MITARKLLEKTIKEHFAFGHFNFAQLEALRAIVQSAHNLKTPIFVGTSEGEQKHIGVRQTIYAVRAFREEFNIPLFLNFDHAHDVEKIKKAIDLGYDAILADFSKLPFEENIRITKEIVEYAKSKNSDIIVEGEIGLLRGDSRIQNERIEVKPEDLADPDQAAHFVKETGVDILAPAVGNVHGIILGEEKLDIERIRAIKSKIGNVHLVLHGASGITHGEIKRAIEAGISLIHINTEIRVAFANSIKATFLEYPDETTPFKLLSSGIVAMQKVIEEKLKIFGSINKL